MSKCPLCSHLRVFAPEDLSRAHHSDSRYHCVYASSSTKNGYTETTVLIRKYIGANKVCNNGQVAKQGSQSSHWPTGLGLDPTIHVSDLLQEFANTCSTCLLIYYVPSKEGFLHYAAIASASSLSAVLNKIDAQPYVCQPCSIPTLVSSATESCQQSGHYSTAACGGVYRRVLFLGHCVQLMTPIYQVKQDRGTLAAMVSTPALASQTSS